MLNSAQSIKKLGNARAFSALTASSSSAPARSVFDSMFRRSSMPRVDLTLPFPELPPLDAPKEVTNNVELTTLPNGLRVLTGDSSSPISSVGVFIDTGSRYESNAARSGISHFLETIAFQSTKDRSHFRLVREMLKCGANIMCSTSREHTIYAVDSMQEYVPQAVATLADVIQNHAFDEAELLEAKENYHERIAGLNNIPDVQIMEAIHKAGYFNNTLGLPLYASEHTLQNMTADVLEAHMKTFFTPNRMVVSAIGVEHEQLCHLVSEEFSDLADPADISAVATPALYTGGDVRLHRPDELTHFAIAFETASWHDKDLVPMCVLQMMMGGGGSFSAGGPGKGMYSRLYESVLNKHSWMNSATSFNSIHTDSSLFGIYGTAHPQQAQALVKVVCDESAKMAGPVDAEELGRAKTQLKSAVLMQLETRGLKLEDLGRQLITYNKIKSAADICAEIDAVTADDIQRTASAMLKTKPSVAAYGDLSLLPRYDSIVDYLK